MNLKDKDRCNFGHMTFLGPGEEDQLPLHLLVIRLLNRPQVSLCLQKLSGWTLQDASWVLKCKRFQSCVVMLGCLCYSCSLSQTMVIHFHWFTQTCFCHSFILSIHPSISLSPAITKYLLSANWASRSSLNLGSMNELRNSKLHCCVLHCFVIVEDNIRTLVFMYVLECFHTSYLSQLWEVGGIRKLSLRHVRGLYLWLALRLVCMISSMRCPDKTEPFTLWMAFSGGKGGRWPRYRQRLCLKCVHSQAPSRQHQKDFLPLGWRFTAFYFPLSYFRFGILLFIL